MSETLNHKVMPGTESATAADHWYLHFWPWVLIAIPFSAVLFGILMIVMVASYPDDLVADEYYKDGMAINQIMTLDKNAAKMGVTARMLDSDGDSLRFLVENANDSVLLLKLYHVTDSELDTSIVLFPLDDGIYASAAVPAGGELDENSANKMTANEILSSNGIWYLELNGAEASWRLRARIKAPISSLLMEAK
jgi:uncharacterized protein